MHGFADDCGEWRRLVSDRTARETKKHKTEVEVEKESPAGDRPRGVVREKSPVFRLKTVNE